MSYTVTFTLPYSHQQQLVVRCKATDELARAAGHYAARHAIAARQTCSAEINSSVCMTDLLDHQQRQQHGKATARVSYMSVFSWFEKKTTTVHQVRTTP